MRGAEWIIARGAESCHHVSGNLYFLKTDPYPGAPRLRIYFTIQDENYCQLEWVEVTGLID